MPAVAEMTSFGTRWLEQLLSRTNARGSTALGDQRRHNGWAPKILKPALLARLRRRVGRPPADGGGVVGTQGGGRDGRRAGW